MTAETRHPLAGTYQTCRVCDGTYLVLADGTLDAHHPGRDTSVNCDGAAETLPIPVTEQTPIQNFLDEFPELANTPVRFWTCPIREHRRPREPVVTVEWIDGIAHCTAPGCTNTSAPTPAPVPSGVDGIRAKLADELDNIGVDGEQERDWFLTSAMGYIEEALDRRDAEITRLRAAVAAEASAKADAYVTADTWKAKRDELSTALREMARQSVRARRGFVQSNNMWAEHTDLLRATFNTKLAEMAAERDRLAAENAELRTYTETTRYHQQRHADAVRELEKLRAEQGAPVVDLADQMRAARELNELRRIAESVRNALDQPRPALRDRHGRVWQPAPNDLYTLGPSGLPGHRCEIAWERTYVEREFGELTEVPAERGEAT